MSGMVESREGQAIDVLFDMDITGLVSFGTAGALAGDIQPGDIVMAEKIQALRHWANSRTVSVD